MSRKAKIWITLSALAFSGLGVLGFFAHVFKVANSAGSEIAYNKPWEAIKVWRARQQLAEAKSLQLRGSEKEAFNLVLAAMKLAPEDIEVSRFLAKNIVKQSFREGVQVYEKIIKMEGATVDDHLELTQILVDHGDMTRAERHLQKIENKGDYSEHPWFLLLRARWLDASGRIDGALQYVDRALAQESEYREEAYLLKVKLCIRSGSRNRFEEGKQLLDKLSEGEGEASLKALRFYYSIRGYSVEEAHRILKKTKEHPLSERGDVMKAFALVYSSDPSARKECIKSLATYFDFEDTDDLYDYCLWLGSLREWSMILKYLTLDEVIAKEDKRTFLLRMDALANLQDWQTIETDFANRKVPIEAYWRQVFRGRAFMEMGDSERAKVQWDQAIGNLENQEDELLRICLYLERIKEIEGLGYFLRKVSALPKYEVFALDKLLGYEAKKVSLEEMRDWVGRLSLRKPEVKPLLNDLAYFNLLSNKDVSRAIEVSSMLFVESPGTLGYRVTYALGLIRMKKYMEGLEVLEAPFINWNNARPAWVLIYAKVLDLNGYTEKASEYRKRINFEKLPRSEREGMKLI